MLRSILQRPEGLLASTFAGLILLGTIGLALPISHAAGTVSLLDALFTATSAVCVTGLITRDTATDFTPVGQTIILILIQLGALGVMTFGAIAFQILRKKVPFQSHAALQSALFQGETSGNLRAALRLILLIVFSAEALGAVLIYSGLCVTHPDQANWFDATFLSISAFCNAGFSVYSDSTMGLRDSGLIMFTLMGLIIAGGLGYTVIIEVFQRGWRAIRRSRRAPVCWSLNSRVVLGGSGTLILLGMAALLFIGLSPIEEPVNDRALDALFQSVTARTAGFNTVDIGQLSTPALMVLIPLMFIGGAPGSCAGGVKVTTVTVWLARIRARLRDREDVILSDRRLPHGVVRRAAHVFALAVLWNVAGVALLTLTENAADTHRLEELIFEQVSAFGTVGLSTGITPLLTPIGKVWLILSMFAGRLGPLTIALAIMRPAKLPPYSYPTERVMIG